MMNTKMIWKSGIAALSIAGLLAVIGCDWTTGEGGYSTTGSGASVSFAGFYQGMLSGGRAVSNTSGGNITSLVISQRGDALDVRDNNGSVYRGRVGEVTIVNATGPTFSSGTQLAHAQVYWSGWDNVAATEVEFVGTIRVVAVADIVGESSMTERETSSGSESESTTDDTTETITETVNIIENGTVMETVTTIDAGEVVITTTVRENLETGETTTTTSRQAKSDTSSQTRSSTSATQDATMRIFEISEQNAQYRLEGTWIEQPGVSAQVDALAPGNAGQITIVE